MWAQNITDDQYWDAIFSMGYAFWCGVLVGIIVLAVEMYCWWKIKTFDHVLFYVGMWLFPIAMGALTMFLLGGI